MLKQFAIGVDVSIRRGLDVVVLDETLRVVCARSHLSPEDLREVILAWRPGCVAIDSPPGPGRELDATSRACERSLRALGVNIFLTPSNPHRFAHEFYNWVRVGAQAFAAAAAAGYPVQDDAAIVRGRALEVFPHASDVFLRGCLPPVGTTRRVATKRAWRSATLQAAGIAPDELCTNRRGEPTLDSIDAALAALTAWHALAGNFTACGDAGEWIVVPGSVASAFSREVIAG